MFFWSEKTYSCNGFPYDKPIFSSKGLNKRLLEQSGAGPLEKYRGVLNEKVNVTSNNRGFRTNNHSVVTYEQVQKTRLLLPQMNSREWWNSHSTASFVRYSIFFPYVMSCFGPILYVPNNFLEQ